MTRFTLRSALVLAVVLLLAGATTSFGAVILTVASSGNPPVRIAGQTEGTGDINLNTDGGTFPAGNGNMVITFIYSAPITNKSLTGNTVACAVGVCAVGTITAGSAPGISVTINGITVAGAAVNVSWNASGNILNISFSPTTAAGAITFNNGAVNTTIAIKGVRVNAASLGVPPSSPVITAFINANPTTQVTFAGTAPTLTVGTLAAALASVTRIGGSTNSSDAFYTFAKKDQANASFGSCTAGTDVCNTAIDSIRPKSSYTNCGIRGIPEGQSVNGTLIITGDKDGIDRNGARDFGGNGGSNAIGIRVVEGFPGALTTRTQESAKSNAGEVDNGVRVRFTFTGVPAQVVIAAPEEVTSAQATVGNYTSTGLTMALVNANNCGVIPDASAGKQCGYLADVRGGATIIFDYEVVINASGGVTASSINVPFFVFQSSSPVDLGTIGISVQLAPILGSNIVRFSDTQTAFTSTVAITACTTDLFYPFVTNVAGFDTGVFVANGGQQRDDNSGQSGTCTFRFYDGSTSGTTAVKTSTSPTLGPGQSFSFTVSDATLGKPGFGNGYINARCNFQYAHGASYVTFAFGTAPIGSAPPGTIYLAMQCNPEDGCSAR